jgi:hypothetical protein
MDDDTQKDRNSGVGSMRMKVQIGIIQITYANDANAVLVFMQAVSTHNAKAWTKLPIYVYAPMLNLYATA